MNALQQGCYHLLFYGVLLIAGEEPEKRPALEFVDVPVNRAYVPEDSFYADIINRCEPARNGATGPVLDTGSRGSNAHESTHRINAQIRNQRGGTGINAFYVMSGKAVVLREPHIRKSAVASLVPVSLRGDRYANYVLGMRGWDDQPLYLCDEWSAYTNACFVALDDLRHGRARDDTDRTQGPLELGVYCVALGMAVERYDPTYWQGEPQFREFLRWHWKRAKTVFDHGRDRFPSQGQEVMLRNLREQPDAAGMRGFVVKYLDGVWLK